MSIIQQLIILLLVMVTLYGIIVAQTFALARVYHSLGWWLLTGGLMILGARQIWGFIKLPAAVLEAQVKGVMPESLTTEQWILTAALVIALLLIIVAFDKLRRDLRRLGI